MRHEINKTGEASETGDKVKKTGEPSKTGDKQDT